MRVSFEPFGWAQAVALSQTTGIDYLGTDFTKPHFLCVSGWDASGQLAGVAVFEFMTPYDAHFSIAIRDRRCISRRVMRAMFSAVFSRAARVTALIEPWNESAIAQARRMGFQPEGFMRRAVEGSRDALLFGMLPEDCRYLPRTTPTAVVGEEVRHGQHAQSA